MSQTVRYEGKVKKINVTKDQIEMYLFGQLSQNGIDRYNDHLERYGKFDNAREMLDWTDELYEKYLVVEDGLYEVLSKESKDIEYDMFEANLDLDGSIDFHVMYYNGGCSFGEAIEQAILNMNKG